MENDMIVYDENVPAIADDSLLRVAEMAEKRIDAVIKIKQMALKVTNASDWVDQNGKPYLLVSGSEKVANLFNISWRIDEPTVETEADGHFTYNLRGVFSIPGRSVSAEGSRSSKDPFFKKYEYIKEAGKPDKKVEKPISAIDRRDVRMAALTNLLGNGITRILGIRNLSYDDLEKYAAITKEMISAIDYKKNGKEKPPIGEPQKKGDAAAGESVISGKVEDVSIKEGTKNNKPWKLYGIKVSGTFYNTFSDTFHSTVKQALESDAPVKITFTTSTRGNDIKTLILDIPEEREVGQEG